jgi:glycosyltransferase involved in cell wall biosynthesis
VETLSIAWLNQLDSANPWSGGAERHIYEVCRRLAKRGHEVTVYAERLGDMPAAEVREGVHFVRPAGRMGLHLWALLNLRERLRLSRFDAVVHDLSKVLPWRLGEFDGTPTLAVVRHMNGKLLMEEAPKLTGPLFWFAERMYAWAYRGVPFVTEAAETKRVLTALGVPGGSINLVRPGVDHQVFTPEPAEKSRDPEVLYVGRLKVYKGADLAIRAFAEVRRWCPTAHLTIVGRGPEEVRLVELTRRLGLGESVTFAGFVPEADLPPLYRRAWVHVQPSQAEGWGYTVIEAAACGTPTVAFPCGALPESVGPVSSPFLADSVSAEALASSLIRCLAQLIPDPYGLTAALRDYALEFDWDATALAYERLLMSVSERSGPAPIGYSARSRRPTMASGIAVPRSSWAFRTERAEPPTGARVRTLEP